jgi:hypothetical protein
VSRGEDRNAELSRATIVTAGGAALIGMGHQVLAGGPASMIALALGGGGVAAGLVLLFRALTRRTDNQ